MLSKKIGHPFNKEYAIGAVTLKNSILSDAALEVSQVYIHEETEQIRKLLKKRFSHSLLLLISAETNNFETRLNSCWGVQQPFHYDLLKGSDSYKISLAFFVKAAI